MGLFRCLIKVKFMENGKHCCVPFHAVAVSLTGISYIPMVGNSINQTVAAVYDHKTANVLLKGLIFFILMLEM